MPPRPALSARVQAPGPIRVVELFPGLLEGLLGLLGSLSGEEWARRTSCPGWSVHDVALHLLGGDVGIVSRKRDAHRGTGGSPLSWTELVGFINQWNDAWIQATRRVSPRLLVDLLATTGPQVHAYFRTLDPDGMGDPVDWVGSEPAPVWLDLAREYVERWHHQQQIRDAVGRPGFKDPAHLAPVLEACVRALPRAYARAAAAEGTAVALSVVGPSGGEWSLVRREERWVLLAGEAPGARASIRLDEDTAWRLFLKGIDRGEARRRAAVTGEPSLAEPAFGTVSVIA